MARVHFETTAGEIGIEVFCDRAPAVADHFLGLVDRGVYDGASFYRSTTLGVSGGPSLIQGGPLSGLMTGKGLGAAADGLPPLLEEFETTVRTGLEHRAGIVSLARDLLGTGHVLPEIFICLGDFPQLDFGGRSEPDDRGFPAFGEVFLGMDVAREIAEAEPAGTTPIAMLEGQILTTPVTISRACRG
ncbi:MAG: peptidylprolyl isomerase [Deltaproteobacteria bacterium]|nr:peptidylprolyl isomerase [Deltaproteobacteria bacterium]